MDQKLSEIRRQLESDPGNKVLREAYENRAARLPLTGLDAEYLEEYTKVSNQADLDSLNKKYKNRINPKIEKTQLTLNSDAATYLSKYIEICEEFIREEDHDNADLRLTNLNEEYPNLDHPIKKYKIFIQDLIEDTSWYSSSMDC